MPVRRLTLLIAVLTGLFVLGVALAVGGLLALRDPGVALVCAVAVAAGIAAATLSYLAARAAGIGAEQDGPEPVRELALRPAARTQPVRIQALPVAELPAPYVAAVMKGLRANRAAMKAPHSSSPAP